MGGTIIKLVITAMVMFLLGGLLSDYLILEAFK